MKAPLLFHLFLFIGITNLHAQQLQIQEVEYEIDKKKGENYVIVPLKDKGLVKILLSQQPIKKNKEVFIELLDRNLVKVWQSTHQIKLGTSLVDRYTTDKYLYLLFWIKNDDYQISRVNLKTGDVLDIEYENLKNFFITHFKVSGNTIFFGGIIKNYPAVIGYDFQEKKQLIFSSVNQLKAEIVDIDIDREADLVSVVLFQDHPARDRGFYINRYNFQARLLSNYVFRPEDDLNFLTFRSHIINQYEVLFLGTYSQRGSDRAQGIYVMKVVGDKTEFLKFYDFAEFDYFFKFLKPKRRERVIAKIEEKLDRGKVHNFRFDMFVHELTFQQGQIIFSGEVYDPIDDRARRSFASSYSRGYGTYGSRDDPSMERFLRSVDNFNEYVPSAIPKEKLPLNRTFPDEFEYRQTFACAFNNDGELLWDNSMSFENYVDTEYPLELSKVFVGSDSLVFAQIFKEENKPEKLMYVISDRESYTDSTRFYAFEPSNEKIKIDNFESGGLLYWFDNHILTSGLKTVKIPNDGQPNRDFFFIRKISFYPHLKEE